MPNLLVYAMSISNVTQEVNECLFKAGQAIQHLKAILKTRTDLLQEAHLILSSFKENKNIATLCKEIEESLPKERD